MRALPLARNGRTKEPGDQGRNPGARRPLLSTFQAMEGKIAQPRLNKRYNMEKEITKHISKMPHTVGHGIPLISSKVLPEMCGFAALASCQMLSHTIEHSLHHCLPAKLPTCMVDIYRPHPWADHGIWLPCHHLKIHPPWWEQRNWWRY